MVHLGASCRSYIPMAFDDGPRSIPMLWMMSGLILYIASITNVKHRNWLRVLLSSAVRWKRCCRASRQTGRTCVFSNFSRRLTKNVCFFPDESVFDRRRRFAVLTETSCSTIKLCIIRRWQSVMYNRFRTKVLCCVWFEFRSSFTWQFLWYTKAWEIVAKAAD